jgi:hypothetical protein
MFDYTYAGKKPPLWGGFVLLWIRLGTRLQLGCMRLMVVHESTQMLRFHVYIRSLLQLK